MTDSKRNAKCNSRIQGQTLDTNLRGSAVTHTHTQIEKRIKVSSVLRPVVCRFRPQSAVHLCLVEHVIFPHTTRQLVSSSPTGDPLFRPSTDRRAVRVDCWTRPRDDPANNTPALLLLIWILPNGCSRSNDAVLPVICFFYSAKQNMF